MLFKIKHKISGSILFSLETSNLKLCVEAAVKSNAYLWGADLRGADLRGAYLGGADLRGADLGGAYLGDAYLGDAYLGGAYLGGADLRGAYLRGAYLRGAYLGDAYLWGADLRGAYLGDAYLWGADLRGAYLRGADLRGAYLGGAYLRGADLRGAYLGGAYLGDAYLGDAYLGDSYLGIKPASSEEAVANLDKVREIIIESPARLYMSGWHGSDAWLNRTCAEEAVCGTTHCLAGWLQVCATDPKIRKLSPNIAGIICAPIASHMFYKTNNEVMSWLNNREYAKESE